MSMRLVFFGSSEFAVPILRALREKHKILTVVTQPDRPKGRGLKVRPTPVKAVALQMGLEVREPERLDRAFLSALMDLEPELFVVCSYGKILPREYLSLPPLGAVNVHPSLLPKYRGAAPIQRALMKGEEETGVTTFLMDEGVDSGPILLQRRTSIRPDEKASELSQRLSEMGAQLLLETLDGLKDRSLRATPQDHTRACYAPKIERHEALIPWERPAQVIKDLIRALEMAPGAYTFFRGKVLKIYEAKTAERRGKPGEVIGLGEGIEVACGEGSLVIYELQLEGRRRMKASEFLRGHPIIIGERLGGERP